MGIKNQSIVGLFILLVIILAVNPKIVNNIYGTVLGRVFLIGVTIFFSMYNTTLGLLVALAIISGLNQFGSFTEGFEPVTVGDDTGGDKGDTVVLTKGAVDAAKKRVSDLKQEISDGTMGVDKEAIKTAIMSKDSKAIPTDPNMTSSSEDVTASSASMLNSNTSLEGYSNYAPY
jgi:hypothetical protein